MESRAGCCSAVRVMARAAFTGARPPLLSVNPTAVELLVTLDVLTEDVQTFSEMLDEARSMPSCCGSRKNAREPHFLAFLRSSTYNFIMTASLPELPRVSDGT